MLYTQSLIESCADSVFFCALFSHGLSRTDYHIQYDPQLNFRKFVRERRGRTGRSTAADLSATNLSFRGLLLLFFSPCLVAIFY